MAKNRWALEQRHTRKLLVIVDETPEVYCALFYAAAGRVQHAGGLIQLLYVIEPACAAHGSNSPKADSRACTSCATT
jgi:hypothetical protein